MTGAAGCSIRRRMGARAGIRTGVQRVQPRTMVRGNLLQSCGGDRGLRPDTVEAPAAKGCSCNQLCLRTAWMGGTASPLNRTARPKAKKSCPDSNHCPGMIRFLRIKSKIQLGRLLPLSGYHRGRPVSFFIKYTVFFPCTSLHGLPEHQSRFVSPGWTQCSS